MTVLRSLQQKLAASIKSLRRDKGLSAESIGKELGWSQSKVSKIENGRTRPVLKDIEALLGVLDPPEAERSELLELAKAIHADSVTWDRSLAGGLAGHQRKIADLEARASEIRFFNCDVIPGLLQTADYARRVLTLGDANGLGGIANAVAARIERQTILYEESKKFRFLMTEAVLRWQFGSTALMRAQYDRIETIAALDNVSIRVIPFSREVTTLQPEAFVLYRATADESSVRVETHTREWSMTDPDETDLYLEVFESMWSEALEGERVVKLFRKVSKF